MAKKMNRLLIRDVMTFHGHEVMEASDGREAVEIAKERLPDLIQPRLIPPASAIELLFSAFVDYEVAEAVSQHI